MEKQNSAIKRINTYLEKEMERLDLLISENPMYLRVKDVAKFLKIDDESVRSAIECGVFGMAWRKSGKLNKAFHIPTAQFALWYIGGMKGIFGSNYISYYN